MDHLRNCEELREENRTREELLKDDERCINWMKSIQERRKHRCCSGGLKEKGAG